MNQDVKTLNHGKSDHADTDSEAPIADFTRVVSYAVGTDRDARRREKIREELVREYFAQEQIDCEQKATPRHRSLLLKLFKLN